MNLKLINKNNKMVLYSDNDLMWLNKIRYNYNINYELEIRIRINDKATYEKIFCEFKRSSDLKIHEKNIQDDILYEDGFKIVKRKENEKETCYSKKILKTKQLDIIPGIIHLSSERDYNIKDFDNKYKTHQNKTQKIKKRISFSNEYISFDFSEHNKEYDIEIEILDCKKYKDDIIIKNIISFLSVLPESTFVMHDINKYKKYIKQPSALSDKESIRYKFCVTPKFDGLRAQLYIDGKKRVFIVSNNFKNIKLTNLSCNSNNTLIDGELVHNRIFFAFDLIVYKNDMLNDKCIFERLNLLKYDIDIKNNNENNIIYEIKKYYFDDIYKDSKKIIQKKYNYVYNNDKIEIPKDGLIFIDVKNNYINSIIFKWKKEITFDFKVEKIKTHNKKEEWALECYNKENKYVEFKNKELINLKESEKYENGDIVEFKYNKTKNIFIPIRKRDDKDLPNFIDIANDNMNCLIKNITF